MLFRGSAGHEIDTESKYIWDIWHGRTAKRPGDRCREEISYSVMDGTGYCRRILKLVEEPQTPQNI
jgi:hypothetical protein